MPSAVFQQAIAAGMIVGAVPAAILDSLFLAVSLAGLGALAGWLTWPMCYRASIDGRTTHYSQVTGSHQASISDIVNIKQRRVEAGTRYYIHLVDGERAILEGNRGRDFIAAVLQLSPSINPPKGL